MYRQAYKCNLSEFPPNLTSNLCPVEFDRSNWVNNAWSNCVKLGVNPLRLHCLLKALDLNGFTPNSTGRIGCKSIEIMTTKFDQAGILCTGRHTNVISVNFHPI